MGGVVHLLDAVYPVGHILQTTNADYNPNSLFPWMTWELTETSDGAEERVLLWENASPNSDFVSQTIDLDIDGDFILVKLLGYKGPNGNYYYTETRLLPVGDTLSVVDMLLNTTISTSILYVGHRNIIVDTDGVTFGSGKLKNYAGAITQDDGYVIPLEIYDIRKLFNETSYYWRRTA